MIVKVKWGKESYDVDVDLSATGALLKAQLQSLTGVPAEKQKIMGVKGGQLKNETPLADAGLSESKPLMLIGTSEAPPSAPLGPVVFAEDHSGGIETNAAMTNGLINVGNTCYMNSAIQTLRLIPELRPILKRCSVPLGREQLNVFQQLDEQKDPVAPLPLWLALMTQFPNFGQTDSHGHPMQHDAQEALAGMLQMSVQTIANDPELNAKYGSLFTGRMLQTTKIVGDAAVAPREEHVPFQILPCNISGEAQTLEAGLEQAMSDTFTGASDGSEVTFQKTSRFSTLPEYLFVHFVRFQWRKDINAKTKILKPITFPLVLDVLSMCTDELKKSMEPAREVVRKSRDKEIERRKRQRQKSGHDEQAAENTESDAPPPIPDVIHNENGFYELCGVISHKGRDSDGGHYVAWVLKAGTWLVVDDKNVAPVSVEDVRRLRGVGEAHIAYVLLYRSRDPVTGALPLLL